MSLESAQKLRKNGDKVQRVHVDLEVFFSQEAIGLSNDKIYSATVLLILRENLICSRVLFLKEAVINHKIN